MTTMVETTGNSRLAAIKGRLKAWWDGVDETPGSSSAPVPTAEVVAAEASEDAAVDLAGGWSKARLDLIQRVFGPGRTRPGGQAAIDALLAPLSLSRKSTILVIGAGLGAGARTAGALGAQVTAIESNPQIAAAANRSAERAEDAQLAPVQHGDYDKLKISPASLDGVVAQEALFPLNGRSRLLFNLRKMLKLSGKMVTTDYFRRCEVDNPNYLVWTSHEGIESPLHSPDEYRKELLDIGFEIDEMTDITAEYCGWVVSAFNAHAAYLKQNPAAEALRRITLAEGEIWSRRLALMASGDLVVLRTVASVPWRG
jgi:cyclopropane fatty-acyl-phospholipid synthase-like methyltransferase